MYEIKIFMVNSQYMWSTPSPFSCPGDASFSIKKICVANYWDRVECTEPSAPATHVSLIFHTYLHVMLSCPTPSIQVLLCVYASVLYTIQNTPYIWIMYIGWWSQKHISDLWTFSLCARIKLNIIVSFTMQADHKFFVN